MKERYERIGLDKVRDTETGIQMCGGGIACTRLNAQNAQIKALTTWVPIELFVEPETLIKGRYRRFNLLQINGVVSVGYYTAGRWYTNSGGHVDVSVIIAFTPTPDPSTFTPPEQKASEAELQEVFEKVVQNYFDLTGGEFQEFARLMEEARELLNR